jgi:hypothetical protein
MSSLKIVSGPRQHGHTIVPGKTQPGRHFCNGNIWQTPIFGKIQGLAKANIWQKSIFAKSQFLAKANANGNDNNNDHDHDNDNGNGNEKDSHKGWAQ